MNEQLIYFARTKIKDGLAQCTEEQQLIFKRMYSHKNLNKDINKVVDDMPEDRLDWVMQQVESTVNKFHKKDGIKKRKTFL